MKKVSVLLVLLSAIVYAVPFLWSASMWWLVFLFPIPLLYGSSRDNFSFKYGFLWGVITFLLHGIGGVSVVGYMAHDYWLWGVVLGLSIVIYEAICVGLVFWLFQRCVQCLGVYSVGGKLLINTLMVAFVIFWIDRGCFFIFGVIEGYPLMHPLLMLMHYPPLLFLLPFMGKQLLTMIFLCFPASIVGFLLCKNRVAGTCIVLAIIPWVLSVSLYTMQSAVQEPSWVKHIIAFPHMTSCKSLYPVSMVKSVAQQIRAILEQHDDADCIIMPESAFDSEILSMVPELLALWGEQYLAKPVHMIFGASRVRDGKYYNCCLWIYNGVLQECFDKQHTMVLSERIPQWLGCQTISSMYRTNGCCEVACGLDPRSAIHMKGVVLVPYLCSELFFNEYPHDLCKEPILALVNDSVFGQSYCSGYIQDLLVVLACFKALMWQRDIAYVSYAHTLFINKQGIMSQLQQ